MTPRGHNPDQETLLVTSERTGQIQARDMYVQDEGAINRVEQKLHLINCLTELATANMLGGVVTVGPRGKILDRFGDEASSVVIASGKKAETSRANAQTEFQRAVGLHALIDSGLTTEAIAKRTVRGMFSDFLKTYYLQPDNKKSSSYREQLSKEIEELQTWQTIHNREHGLRPHRPAKEPDFMPSVQDRLVALNEDPRAGFLPTTHTEKNTVLSWLDYLDNPTHPLGVTDQLLEVMGKQRKERQTNRSIRPIQAMVSIVHEIGDYYNNASEQLVALRDLEAILRERPKLKPSLAEEAANEEIDLKHPGFAPLIRFFDLSTIRAIGHLPGVAYPMTPREDRWTDKGDGKHKIVEDKYTGKKAGEEFAPRVLEQAAGLTVGEARKAISTAIIDQQKRQAFHEQRLREISSLRYGPKTAPRWSIAALDILTEHQQRFAQAS